MSLILKSKKIGDIYLEATERGISRLSFTIPANHKTKDSPESNKHLKHFAKEFKKYQAKKLKRFTVKLDLSGQTPFTQTVLKQAFKIPFGQALSYGELAEKINNPKACRAIGGAMGRNPIPLIIPCHRILASEEKLGGFSAGLKIKKRLLSFEDISYLI